MPPVVMAIIWGAVYTPPTPTILKQFGISVPGSQTLMYIATLNPNS